MTDAIAIAQHDDNPVRSRLRDTFPVHWAQLLQLLVAYLALTGGFALFGWLITGPFDDNPIVRADDRVQDWFVASRTALWTDLTWWGSMLADTFVKIAATAIIAGVLLAVWKRWFEPAVLAISLILEASAFISITFLVGRPRPDDPLEASPVDSSFPSGHTAAAMAYGALAVIVFWHTRKWWARTAIVVVTAVVPIIAGVSRMYRGMHHLSDVVAGLLLGALSVTLTVWILARTPEARDALRRSPDDESAATLTR